MIENSIRVPWRLLVILSLILMALPACTQPPPSPTPPPSSTLAPTRTREPLIPSPWPISPTSAPATFTPTTRPTSSPTLQPTSSPTPRLTPLPSRAASRTPTRQPDSTVGPASGDTATPLAATLTTEPATSLPATLTPEPTSPPATLTPEPTTPPVIPPTLPPVRPQRRYGAGVPSGKLTTQVAQELGLGWYLTWSPYVWNSPPGVEYWPMVRVSAEGFKPGVEDLTRLVGAHPGATWIVGNEPDVMWQDNMLPEQYAKVYNEVYTLIKQTDLTARISPAGISQATPLRMRYLDMVLDNYQTLYGQPLPADVWTLHAFILREQIGSWGTGIPPGLSDTQGELIEIEQHNDMDIFRQRIVRFRRWMADHGYRNCELAITEYGVLMPADYGFPPEQVRSFMWATFDYFTTAADGGIGMPGDGNRLVQRWAWFSISDTLYPAGDLVDPATGQLTEAGRAFAEYVRTH